MCPVRFVEGSAIFAEVGRLAFGEGVEIVVAPEMRILRSGVSAKRKLGKVDFLIARLDSHKVPVDFAALEVQAVYFSGESVRPAFEFFLRHGHLRGEDSLRRPDYRSSAQKRLMPQLSLKVPVFRRWGKKFFVAVDEQFFNALPEMKTIDSISNSEITWLVYPFRKGRYDYHMGKPKAVFTVWDDVLTALREGIQPEPGEILQEVSDRINLLRHFRT